MIGKTVSGRRGKNQGPRVRKVTGAWSLLRTEHVYIAPVTRCEITKLAFMIAPRQEMPFATTKSLNLRAFRESDSERLIEMYNDQRVSRSATTDYVVAMAPDKGKKLVEGVNGALLHLIIEVKSDYDEGRAAGWSEEERWVGHINLGTRVQKNRDASMGIALSPRWWGKGFGTEAVEWLVKYTFEQLAMHRVSLGVLGNNSRAISLYKKSYVVAQLSWCSFGTDANPPAVASPKKGGDGNQSGRMVGGTTTSRWGSWKRSIGIAKPNHSAATFL